MVFVSTLRIAGQNSPMAVPCAPDARSRPERTGRDEVVTQVMTSAPLTAAFGRQGFKVAQPYPDLLRARMVAATCAATLLRLVGSPPKLLTAASAAWAQASRSSASASRKLSRMAVHRRGRRSAATHLVKSLGNSTRLPSHSPIWTRPGRIRIGLSETARGSRLRAGPGSNCLTIQFTRSPGPGMPEIVNASVSSVNGRPDGPRNPETLARSARDIRDDIWDRVLFNKGPLGGVVGLATAMLVLGPGRGLLLAATHFVL